jgi:hypothetical protein
MALSLTENITEQTVRDGYYVADASNWDHIIWQFIGLSGAVEFFSSNDSGAITGVTDGNSLSATAFSIANFYDISTTNFVTSTAGSGLFRSTHVGQFVKVLLGGGATIDKVIIQYHKFS